MRPIYGLHGSDQIYNPKYQHGCANNNTYAAANDCVPSRVVRNVPAFAPGSRLARYHGSRTPYQGDDAKEDKEPVLALSKAICAHHSHFHERITAAALP